MVEYSAVTILEFLIILKQGFSQFRFALGPTNYVTCLVLLIGGYVTVLSQFLLNAEHFFDVEYALLILVVAKKP